MADRPARPGKHVARHRAPTATQRLVTRLTPSAPTSVLRVRALPRLGHPKLAALAATGLAATAVMGTHTMGGRGAEDATAAGDAAVQSALDARSRAVGSEPISRSGDRGSLDDLKAKAMAAEPHVIGRHAGATRVERAEIDYADMDPREIAQSMLPEYGWSESEFSCLDQLWIGESNWDPFAENPYSGAYGIPQSLPAEKMATAGPDWRTNPATQIEWGLNYIEDSYGTPCAANEFKVANNWY